MLAQINYKGTKAKCRHLKKLTCKGTVRLVFIRVYRLEISQSSWYFRPSFVNLCPSNLLVHLPPPPLPYVKVQFIETVAGSGRGCRVLLKTVFCRSGTLCI
jgi:hypothetical protein